MLCELAENLADAREPPRDVRLLCCLYLICSFCAGWATWRDCEIASGTSYRFARLAQGYTGAVERRKPVKYDEFIEGVSQRANIPPDEAVVLARATLETLSERISGGEARDLAGQLPRALQAALLPSREPAEQFRIEEFIRRVSERAVLDTPLAWEGARAVIATLRDAVSANEFDDVIAQLPKDFRELLTPVSRWSAGPQI